MCLHRIVRLIFAVCVTIFVSTYAFVSPILAQEITGVTPLSSGDFEVTHRIYLPVVIGVQQHLYTKEELVVLASTIYNNQISPEKTEQIFDTLSREQRDIITQEIAERTGVQMETLKKEIADFEKTINEVRASSPGYDVQMPHGTGNPNVRPTSWWSSRTCDSDPNDWDFVFFANTPQTLSPSNMRWSATNSWVTWALNTAYGGVLSTYGSHLYQINICLGTNGVNLGGGPINVYNSLRIKYR